MHPTMYWGYGSWGIFGWTRMIFWLTIIVLVATVFIRWVGGDIKNDVGGKSALDILKERYARGEITKKKFEEKKRDLI